MNYRHVNELILRGSHSAGATIRSTTSSYATTSSSQSMSDNGGSSQKLALTSSLYHTIQGTHIFSNLILLNFVKHHLLQNQPKIFEKSDIYFTLQKLIIKSQLFSDIKQTLLRFHLLQWFVGSKNFLTLFLIFLQDLIYFDNQGTVPAPINRGYYSKAIIRANALQCVSYINYTRLHKNGQNAPILGNFNTCNCYSRASFSGPGAVFWTIFNQKRSRQIK